MKTQQAIQSTANVVRITTVTPGDVYKRFEDSYDNRTYYGLVKAVHNDGEETIIEATEYCKTYSGIDAEHKIINGKKDVIIFPSTPDELNLELTEARTKQLKKIEEAKEDIKKAEKLITEIDGLISGKTQKTLKAMSYKELTQEQYNAKKLEIEA